MFQKRTTRFATAIATAITVSLALPAAASAHRTVTNINLGVGYGFVEVNSNHKIIWICDARADNYGVWVEYYDATGYHTAVDPDGKGGNCGAGYSDGEGNTVRSFNGHSRAPGDPNTGWRIP